MSTLEYRIGLGDNRHLEIRAGDISEESVDVIVNAANQTLSHGGGVAAAIVRRGGEVIQRESTNWIKQHGLVTFDRPAYTKAGRLSCSYVVHAAGPVWGEGSEPEKLSWTVRGALKLASSLNAKTLALPPISTGLFGFPKELAAPIIYRAIFQFLAANPDSTLTTIRITIIDQSTLEVFVNALREWQKNNEV